MHQKRGFDEVGGLMAYGSSQTEQYRRAAPYVDKILHGADPTGLPVELASESEFVVNANAARTLGLKLPAEVAAQVTEWVE
jgi:putative ABC transport system substrate-binding protein